MLVITMSAQPPAMGPRGVGGHIDDLLFPIQHGTLWYAAMDVLPPFLVHGTGKVTAELFEQTAQDLTARLLALNTAKPIPFRRQNTGDYDGDLCLKPGLEGQAQGLKIHQRADG